MLDLFDHPEHPYTEALLGALPQLEGEGIRQGRLTAIPGRPPDLIDPPPACRFAPRCPYANDARLLRDARCRSCARSGRATGCARPIRPASAAAAASGGVRHERVTPTERRAARRSRTCSKHFPIQQGLLDRAHGRRRPRRRRRQLRHPRRARRSGSSASPGSGKSTTGYCILQLLKPTAGSVRFEGTGADGARARGACGGCGARCRSSSRIPYCVARPAHDRRRHRRRAAPVHGDRHPARPPRARARAARRRRLQPELHEPLPARVLGRPAPAHRHRARARAQPEADRLRRARVGARRLDPGADPQPAQGPPEATSGSRTSSSPTTSPSCAR